jgi:hypothetical protein
MTRFGAHQLILATEPQKNDTRRALCLNCISTTWESFEFGTRDMVGNRNIHGSHNLPVGYEFVAVPRYAQVERRGPAHGYAEMKFKYSLVRTLVAIIQLLYASTTLYETRVHQINRFGFAAFGLTVAPYIIMSLLNLVAGLFCPDFEELYLVNSSILEEAKSRPDAQFGVVAGDLVE